MNSEKVEKLVKDLLNEIGEDPKREGLLETPRRVAEAYQFLSSGYKMDIDEVMNKAVFNEKYDEMVLVKNIDFYSLCEHHMLPFYGKVHVAYIPDGKIIGLSKIPRLVEIFSRRLQVQERHTTEIADTLMRKLEPKGVLVIIEAEHLCMTMRGVKKPGSMTVTSVVRGIFRKAATRNEAMALIRGT